MATILGNLKTDGQLFVLARAGRVLREEGGIALFVDEEGQCSAYSHLRRDFGDAIAARRKAFVGVYHGHEGGEPVPRQLMDQIDDDITSHVLARKLAARRQAQRQQVAA